jgi:hypothetical protein
MSPRNTYQYDPVGVAGVSKVDRMRVKKALHRLAEGNAVLLGIARGLIGVPLEFSRPNRTHWVTSRSSSFAFFATELQGLTR